MRQILGGVQTPLYSRNNHSAYTTSKYHTSKHFSRAKKLCSLFTGSHKSTHRNHSYLLNSRTLLLPIKNSTSQSTTTTASPIFHELASSGSKINKTSISKHTVSQIRDECRILGIDSEGTKPVLIQRLLDHYNKPPLPPPPPPKIHASSSSSTNTPSNINTTPSTTTSTTTAPPPPPPRIQNSDPIDIHVQWLGTSSGAPTSKRNVSSVAIRYGTDKLFLVDCGEGTHNQLRTAGINPGLVSHIFITHLHGDHCFGIVGTLAAIERARTKYRSSIREKDSSSSTITIYQGPVFVYGPPEVQNILLSAIRSARLQLSIPVTVIGWVFDPEKEKKAAPVLSDITTLRFGLQAPDQRSVMPHGYGGEVQALYDSGSDRIVQQGLTWSVKLPGGVRVVSAQLQHRMPCWGYVFKEPYYLPESSASLSDTTSRAHGRNISDTMTARNHEAADEAAGNPGNGDATFLDGPSNRKIRPGRKIVILGDTCDSEAIAPIAMNCDLLSHEATFNKGMEEKAEIATHSTSEQAGAFARRIRAKSLVLTHFSARYEKAEKFKKVWTAAREKGVSVGELQASVAVGLLEEARAVAAPTRVFLANDYYSFKVQPREMVSEDQFFGSNRGSKKFNSGSTRDGGGGVNGRSTRNGSWQQRSSGGGGNGGYESSDE